MNLPYLLLVLAFQPIDPQEPPAVPDPHAPTEEARRPNHLASETSPYLLQHLYNPVDWYPWGEEALQRAKEEDKPIFLSIGYSACHWCHVMERESFEDEEIAAFLNRHFISIKVDREERPDLDELYMSAVMQMTGSGGWPMSVFLTPDRKPFYGGTYFPPRSSHGRPGFMDLLMGIHEAWLGRREEVEKSAGKLGEALAVKLPPAPDTGLPAAQGLERLEEGWVGIFEQSYDPQHGGFGPAPKFPRADDLRWLLAHVERTGDDSARRMALHTLRRMASGGMYDQIAGGFARYSTDRQWMIPHFEKMLYDQGTLIPAYLEAWSITGEEFFAEVARESCDYLLREMRDPGGAFWSSTDADSEGEEGKFFVWTPAQLEEVLGKERATFAAAFYGVTEKGNFEHGTTALHRASTAEEAAQTAGLEAGDAVALAESVRAALYEARRKRVPPGTDDKILTAWNGLAISALATAGRMLDEPRYTEAASGAASFLLQELRGEDGWKRAWRAGSARHRAVLEDYAYLCRGFLDLFMSTGDESWLAEARTLAEDMLGKFWDEDSAVFWDTDGEDSSLLHRRQTPWDGATPAPNAVALESLLLLHALTQEERWLGQAEHGMAAALEMAKRNPRAFTATLRTLPWAVEEPRVAVVVGAGDRASLAGWRARLFAADVPFLLTVFREFAAPDSELGLFAQRTAAAGKATLYLCEGRTCLPPSNDPTELAGMLAR